MTKRWLIWLSAILIVAAACADGSPHVRRPSHVPATTGSPPSQVALPNPTPSSTGAPEAGAPPSGDRPPAREDSKLPRRPFGAEPGSDPETGQDGDQLGPPTTERSGGIWIGQQHADWDEAAVAGFSIERALRTDGHEYRLEILEAAARGALITIHMPNKDDRSLCELGRSWQNPSPAIESWIEYLDRAVEFLDTMPDVVFLFRPYHEMLGHANWWARGHESAQACDAARAYVTLWRNTHRHMDSEHLRWVWAPDAPGRVPGFADWYPGRQFVDVIAWDRYSTTVEGMAEGVVADASVIVPFAVRQNRPVAIAEFGAKLGLQTLPDERRNWFRDAFYGPLKQAGYLDDIWYALTWADTQHSYWVPETDDRPHGWNWFLNREEIRTLDEL